MASGQSISGPAGTGRAGRGRSSRLTVIGILLIVAAIGLILWSLRSTELPMYDFEVVARFPHDPAAYSQGLLFDEGALLESTGRFGTSSVRRVNLESGEELLRSDLPDSLFGEGLTRLGDRLYQLTWQSGIARVYAAKDFALLDQVTYEGEGWGLTTDGQYLIRSDGSNLLRFHDPETFEEVRRVRVHVDDQPVDRLNELEWVDGEIWANVWKFDYIARIDPGTGEVLGWIDMTGLFDYQALPDPESVLNGIAYDPESKRVFVTGKLWPWVFEIDVFER